MNRHWIAVFVLLAGAAPAVFANDVENPGVNLALLWNVQALAAIKATNAPPTVAARALAIAHAAIYDAWAAYDNTAVGSLPGSPARRPVVERNINNQYAALSYAAYRTLVDLFPSQTATFKLYMISNLGYDPTYTATDQSGAAGLGNAAAKAQLDFRHGDGSNQLGAVPYADYTGYQPVNSPSKITDPNHWQPGVDSSGNAQTFTTPFWGQVTPFAVNPANQFRPAAPPQAAARLYQQRLRDQLQMNANLSDAAKMSAEFWQDGVGSQTPAGHWNLIAEAVSNRDQHNLDQDVKMFFVLNCAELDTSIAVWDAKRFYDSIQPVSAIHYFYAGQTIQGWAGAGKGVAAMDGGSWLPWVATPSYPEYPSERSALANTAAEILKRFSGNDTYSSQVIFSPGSSVYDPSASPVNTTVLGWLTFSEMAEDASWAGRPGGVQFDEADIQGRVMGRAVAGVVWNRYAQLIAGTH
jgi:hypothetical protein